MAAPTVTVFDLRYLIRRLLVVFAVTIEVHFSDRFYSVFERIAHAVESIDKTLKTTEDFTSEDQSVKAGITAVHQAKERIPHGTPTTN